MGTLQYDFNDDEPWTQPAGWEVFESGTGTVYSRVNSDRYELGGATFNDAECTDLDNAVSDVIVSGSNCNAPFGDYLMVFARADDALRGSWTTYRMYVASDGTSNRWLYIDKFISGTSTSLGSYKVVGLYYTYPVAFRFEVVGETIRAKLWRSGYTEPEWQISVEDSSISSGRVRIGAQGGQALFDNISIESDDITTDSFVIQGNTGELSTAGYDASVSLFGFATQSAAGNLSISGYDVSLVFSGDVSQVSPGILNTSGYDHEIGGETAPDRLWIKYKDEFGNVRGHEIGQLPIITEVSSDFISAETSQCIFVDATSDNLSGYMVTADGRDGVEYNITKVDDTENTVTVIPITGEYINGETTFVLYFQDENITMVGSNGNWRVL